MQKGGRKALIDGTEENNKWKTSNSWIIQIIGIYFLVLKQTRFFSNQKVFIWCLFSYVPVGGTKQHAMHEMICFTLIDWPWTKSFITNWGLSLIGLGNDLFYDLFFLQDDTLDPLFVDAYNVFCTVMHLNQIITHLATGYVHKMLSFKFRQWLIIYMYIVHDNYKYNVKNGTELCQK